MSTPRFSANGSGPDRFKQSTQQQSLESRTTQADKNLAVRYEALSQRLGTAEAFFRHLKPIHAIWVAYGHEYEDSGHCNSWEMLGIVKCSNKWQLCHGWGINDDVLVVDPRPIFDRPVDVRVRAAFAIRKLHEAIIKAKENYVPEVDKAIEEIDSMLLDAPIDL